jgi:hypothetical protein
VKQIIALTILASGAAFAFIFGNEADELTLIDLGIMLAALAIILSVQTALLLLVDRLVRAFAGPAKGLTAARLVGAVFIGSNAYFTAFITYEAAFPIKVALAAGVGIVSLLIMFVQRWQGFALFVMSAYFVMSLGLYGYTRLAMDEEVVTAESPLTVRPGRNVYFIGNESLASPRAYRELYGITHLPHVEYLRRNGFRVLDRAYSADFSTLKSYSRILEFEREITNYDVWRRSAFRSNNSTFASFSSGGYRTQFIYKVTYFGLNPNVVDYTYPTTSFAHCEFSPRRFFYFLCRRWVHESINRYLFGLDFDIGIPLGRIRAAARSEEPWLTFYHHDFPFHSAPTHSFENPEDLEEFRSRIRTSVAQILDRGMDEIVSTIRREDPGAVIVLFGDHGTVSSRGADLDAPEEPLSAGYVFEDRYGVMVAVYPEDFCTNRIFEGSTTAHLVESVINCLNGDDRPSAEELAERRTFYWRDEARDVARYTQLPLTPAQVPSAP